MQVAQLAQTTLDVCHVDLNIILETTKKKRYRQQYKKSSGLRGSLNNDRQPQTLITVCRVMKYCRVYLPEVGRINRSLDVIKGVC